MSLIGKLRVAHTIALAMLVPIATALFFAGQVVLIDKELSDHMSDMQQLAALATDIGDVVHEQQKERGASAGYFGAGGQGFRQELAAQQSETDRYRQALEQTIAGLDLHGVGERYEQNHGRFERNLRALQAEMGKTGAIRAAVSARSISVTDAIAHYTDLNARMLHLLEDIAALTDDSEIVIAVVGLKTFLQGKELAGIERAIGSVGFAAGRFTPEQMDRFKELIAGQKVYTGIFYADATPEQKGIYDQLMAGKAATDVERMRAVAIEGGLEGRLEGIAGTEWFDTITLKIEGLKEIEESLDRDLRIKLEEHSDEAMSHLLLQLGIAAAALLVALAASAGIALTIGRSFRNLVAPTLRLAEGALDVTLPAETRNEFGEMSKALKVLRDNAVARREAEAAETREREVREAAADARREATERLQRSLARAVGAASDGDFSQRVEADFEADDLVEVATKVNGLLTATEAGLGGVARVIENLAEGKLTEHMQGSYSGAFAKLQADVNGTVDRLHELVEQLQSAAAVVYDATKEINQGSTDLSARAESQAASLEETAATMEEIAATVKTNAENAAQVSTLAGETRGQAEKGREVVAETVQAMTDIRESAAEIGDIVATIDSIAFQTNLLALNAAVEAARAGDAGKGFAVVASEVRTLAQRSGEAAKTIKELIDKSTAHVATGDRLVGATDAALAGIVESVRKVAATIEEIASASREQTSGVDEVSVAVSQMDEMTQQNASMADQSAASARSLSEQSQNLVDLIRFFQIRGGSAPGRRAGSQDQTDLRAWEHDSRAERSAAGRPPAARARSASGKDTVGKAARTAEAGNWAEF